MKHLLEKVASRLYFHYMKRAPYYLYKRSDEISGASQVQQLLLRAHYQELARHGQALPSFDDVEFRVYSQNGEDGILWYIFSVIGTTNKTVVEVGAGNGVENNSANLIINHGWTGFLFDASSERVETARSFYESIPQTRLWPPVITRARLEPTNVDEILGRSGVQGPVDLFSLDIDGIDYWVWEALSIIEPRVVVVEFNNLWSADVALTVPNDPDFTPEYNSPLGADYSGATLGAFVKLAARKGYRLVGCQRYGFNAFFVKDSLGQRFLPAADPHACITHPFAVHARTVRQRTVKDRAWISV